jgi:hypothetical protein
MTTERITAETEWGEGRDYKAAKLAHIEYTQTLPATTAGKLFFFPLCHLFSTKLLIIIVFILLYFSVFYVDFSRSLLVAITYINILPMPPSSSRSFVLFCEISSEKRMKKNNIYIKVDSVTYKWRPGRGLSGAVKTQRACLMFGWLGTNQPHKASLFFAQPLLLHLSPSTPSSLHQHVGYGRRHPDRKGLLL